MITENLTGDQKAVIAAIKSDGFRAPEEFQNDIIIRLAGIAALNKELGPELETERIARALAGMDGVTMVGSSGMDGSYKIPAKYFR